MAGFADSRCEFDLSLWESVCIDAFQKAHDSLLAQEDFTTTESGTTATVVLLGCSVPPWVAVANAGDSPAVCGRCADGAWTAIQLTTDHKPDNPHELARIARSG